MVTKRLSGGDKLKKRLEEIARETGTAGGVDVGFLEGATYPDKDGTPVANIAAIQEFGGSIKREASEVTIYRKIKKNGDFARNGKFVKRSQSNFSTTHHVDAYTIVIPPRPFFRNMISKEGDGWGDAMAAALKDKKYNAARALKAMGDLIKGQLQSSIRDFTDPPNAASTVAKKEFDDPLIDTGHMLNSVEYAVKK